VVYADTSTAVVYFKGRVIPPGETTKTLGVTVAVLIVSSG
jgi:hypothetical protein